MEPRRGGAGHPVFDVSSQHGSNAASDGLEGITTMTTLTSRRTNAEIEPRDRRTLAIAWIATLALSALPEVALVQVLGIADPPGGWMRVAVAVALTVSAAFWPAARALRGYFVVMLAVILVDDVLIGLLGGLVTLEDPQPIVRLIAAYTGPFFLLAVAFAGLLVLGLGVTRANAFLTVGDLQARSRLRLPGMRRSLTWVTAGIACTVFFAGSIAAALAAEGAYADAAIARLLPLLPLVLASACFNAFGEEVVFRAGPLATLHRVVGTGQAVLLTSVWFGSHTGSAVCRPAWPVRSPLGCSASRWAGQWSAHAGWAGPCSSTSQSTRRSCSPSPPVDDIHRQRVASSHRWLTW